MNISLPSLFYFHHSCSFQNPEGKYTQTLAHTHKYYAHTGTYIQKTWIKIFLFFLENVLKIILKISKKTSLYSSTLQTALNISLS